MATPKRHPIWTSVDVDEPLLRDFARQIRDVQAPGEEFVLWDSSFRRVRFLEAHRTPTAAPIGDDAVDDRTMMATMLVFRDVAGLCAVLAPGDESFYGLDGTSAYADIPPEAFSLF
jgi:hypothetical protein